MHTRLERSGGIDGLARQLFLKTIEEIQFEAAVGGKNFVARFGDIAIRIPGGDFGGEANDSGASIAGEDVNGELIKAAFIAVERLADAGNEAIENRNLLTRIALEIL